MFRELTRKNKQIAIEECVTLLKKETRGVLSVLGDNGYPYGMPMNHFYNEDDGNIYFHCGCQSSHRLDSLKRCNKVSFCLYNKGYRSDGDWAYNVKSVIVFGKIEIINDEAVIADIGVKLSRKFTDNERYIKSEIENYGHETLILKLIPENICGKLIKES